MFGELLEELRQEREEIAHRQKVAFSLGVVAKLAWNVTLWTTIFFLIGAAMLAKMVLYMALGGKGWR
jgi:predicted metal-binding membrane protein